LPLMCLMACCSYHSDAIGSLSDLVAVARARGLDFVAVPDHNTVSRFIWPQPAA